MPRTRSARRPTGPPPPQRANSPRPDGEQYLRALIAEQELADGEAVERASDDDADFEDDGSAQSSNTKRDPIENGPATYRCESAKVGSRKNPHPTKSRLRQGDRDCDRGRCRQCRDSRGRWQHGAADPASQGMHQTASGDDEEGFDEGGTPKIATINRRSGATWRRR